MRISRGLFFFFCFSLLKMTDICFGSTILHFFFAKNQEKGVQISLLASGTRNPIYTTARYQEQYHTTEVLKHAFKAQLGNCYKSTVFR